MTQRGAARAALLLLLLVAAALRIHNIGFGLPGMYDPDEPMFMLTALKLPLKGTLNPQWFGHPGSTTIYLVALVDVIVAATALLGGAYGSLGELTTAAYANPAIFFIPARVAMVALGVTSIGLTYVLGRRLHGTAAGLVAAALLTFNALHIAWSQVVRTDIHASVFMLASMIFAAKVAESGRLRHWLLAGFLTGFAIATKWPSAAVFVAVIGAFIYRRVQGSGSARTDLRNLFLAGLTVLVGMFLASPFLFLDWPTVVSNLSGEMRPRHLGHTGGGLVFNLGWYLRVQVAGTMGMVALAAIAAGFILSGLRSRIALFTLVPTAVTFMVLISAQHLIWSRWVLPALPLLCIFAGFAVVRAGEKLAALWPSRSPYLVTTGLAAAMLIPSVAGAIGEARERANDTRAMAVRWAKTNIAPGKTVVLEHLELNLRGQPWKILFPMGAAGCVDAVHLLNSQVQYSKVQGLRRGSSIIDLGNIDPARLDTCRADYAILTYYDLYRAEAEHFPREIETYDKILAGGRTVALFAPRPGYSGGPVVRIVAIPRG
ncbi:MAG: glycosyltransferase family 39 protein [Sphingomicrobium sp.]